MTARPIITTGTSVPDIREAVARAILAADEDFLRRLDLSGEEARIFADAALSVLVPAAVDVVRGKRRSCKVYDLQMSAYNDGIDDAVEALDGMLTKEAADG